MLRWLLLVIQLMLVGDLVQGSDLTGSQTGSCEEGQFACRRTSPASQQHCIPRIWVCDGEPDCPQGDDEDDCQTTRRTCSAEEFLCQSRQSCLPRLWLCDGRVDCTGGQDEENCAARTTTRSPRITTTRSPWATTRSPWATTRSPWATTTPGSTDKGCRAGQFQCTSGVCISNQWRCDGDIDCAGGEDESGCGSRTCAGSEFDCGNSRCVPRAWVCDGQQDCPDGVDERNCTNREESVCTGSGQVPCGATGPCIHKAWLCDGDRDCPGGEDEIGCGITTTTEAQSGTTTTTSQPSRATTTTRSPQRTMTPAGPIQTTTESTHPVVTATPGPAARCRDGWFRCVSGSRQCINPSWVCDNEWDCLDGEDETNCPETTTTRRPIPISTTTRPRTPMTTRRPPTTPRHITPMTTRTPTTTIRPGTPMTTRRPPTTTTRPRTTITTTRPATITTRTPTTWSTTTTQSPLETTTTVVSSCTNTDFHCQTSGRCIPDSWHCDLIPDCPSEDSTTSEDEQQCQSQTKSCQHHCQHLCHRSNYHNCPKACHILGECSVDCYEHCIIEKGLPGFRTCKEECSSTKPRPWDVCVGFCVRGTMDRYACVRECKASFMNFLCRQSCLKYERGTSNTSPEDRCAESCDPRLSVSHPFLPCYQDCLRVRDSSSGCDQACQFPRHTHHVFGEAYRNCLTVRGPRIFVYCLRTATIPLQLTVDNKCYQDCLTSVLSRWPHKVTVRGIGKYKKCMRRCTRNI